MTDTLHRGLLRQYARQAVKGGCRLKKMSSLPGRYGQQQTAAGLGIKQQHLAGFIHIAGKISPAA